MTHLVRWYLHITSMIFQFAMLVYQRVYSIKSPLYPYDGWYITNMTQVFPNEPPGKLT